jgi:cohesin complex subunit SA-1/2
VAGQFLAKYDDDKVVAMKELVNMVLKSAGCNLAVSDDDINDPENVEGKVTDLQDEFQAVSVPPRSLALLVLIVRCSKILPTIP